MRRLFFLAVLALGVLHADHNILSNPDFSRLNGKQVLGWELAQPAPAGYAGAPAAMLGEMTGNRGYRIVQRGLNSALSSLYGCKLEVEYSIMLFVKERTGNPPLLVYCESIPDSFCACATLRDYPLQQWFRVRVRFVLPDKPYRAPNVNVWFQGKGTVYAAGAYLGPVKGSTGHAPVEADEKTDLSWMPGSHCQYAWGMLPSPNTLFTGAKDVPAWTLSGTARYDADENSLRLDRAGDTAAVECPLPKTAAGSPLHLMLQANTNSNPSTRFAVRAAFFRQGKEISAVTSPETGIYVGWLTKDFHYTIPGDGPDQVRFTVTNVTGGIMKFSRASFNFLPPENRDVSWYQRQQRYLRVLNFPVRHTYLLPQKPGKLELEILPGAAPLRVTLGEVAGKTLKTYDLGALPAGKLARRTLELPELPEGAYELLYTGDDLPASREFFRVAKPSVRGVTFDANRWMILNGKPFFPIAMNHIPTNNADFFRVAAASGINTVAFLQDLVNSRGFNYALAVAKHYDLAVMDWTNPVTNRMPDRVYVRYLQDMKRKYDQFPKFIGVLDDESGISVPSQEHLERHLGYNFKYLPEYILWSNHCPRIWLPDTAPKGEYLPYLRRFSSIFDVVSVDVYPVPAPTVAHNRLPNRLLSCVGDFTELAAATGWGQKPTWMILQAWGWGEGTPHALRRPDYAELRFMAWDAILHGATGIDWHSEGAMPTRHGPADDLYGKWWADFALVNRELNAAGQILAGSQPEKVTGKLPKTVRAMVWRNGNEVLYAALNESDHPAAGTFTCPLREKLFDSLTGGEYRGEAIQLPAYGVKLLSTRRLVLKREIFRKQPGIVPDYSVDRNLDLPANWIMAAVPAEENYFRGDFELTEVPASARLHFNTNSIWTLFINGRKIDMGNEQRKVFEYEVAPYLQAGKNSIVLKCATYGAKGKGVVWALTAGGKVLCATDAATLSAADKPENYQPCRVIGPHGEFPKWKYRGQLELVPWR